MSAVKRGSVQMAARLMEKLRTDSEAPDLGRADNGDADAPDAPPAAHGRMAAPDAPPGLELDEHGNPIPLAQRTRHHREEALASSLTQGAKS
jgi:hypothetical protein